MRHRKLQKVVGAGGELWVACTAHPHTHTHDFAEWESSLNSDYEALCGAAKSEERASGPMISQGIPNSAHNADGHEPADGAEN